MLGAFFVSGKLLLVTGDFLKLLMFFELSQGIVYHSLPTLRPASGSKFLSDVSLRAGIQLYV